MPRLRTPRLQTGVFQMVVTVAYGPSVISFTAAMFYFSVLFTALKIFDLQLFTSGIPAIDWASMALISSDFDLMKSSLPKFYTIYYEAFKKSCLSFGLDCPFNIEEFIQDVETKAIPTTFIYMIFFFDPVCREPTMASRVRWIWEKTLECNQDFLN